MSTVIIAEEKSGIEKEKNERDTVVGKVLTELAKAWEEREKIVPEYRVNSIPINVPTKIRMGGSLSGINSLIKKRIIETFGWDEKEFGVETDYSEKNKELKIAIDLL